MKKFFSFFVATLFAASMFAMDELPASQVRPVLSGTYDATCGFGEWGSGTQCVPEGYVRTYTTTNLGYFGMEFDGMNCSQMTTLHMEVFAAQAPLTFRVVPIHGGAEQGVFVTVEEANKWVEVDLSLSEGDFAKVSDWSNVFQIKIDNAPNASFSLAEVFFYTLEQVGEDVKPQMPEGDNILVINEVETYFATGGGWSPDTESSAALNEEGNVVVNIAMEKNATWQAQVKLHTNLGNLVEGTDLAIAFKLSANKDVNGITFKMFDKDAAGQDGPGIVYQASLSVKAGETKELVYVGQKAVNNNGIIVFDFGSAAVGSEIVISDLYVVGTIPAPAPVYEHLYLIGDFQGWKPAEAVEMTKVADNVFSYTDFPGNGYFGFITVQDADWAVVNANRFGAADGTTPVVGVNPIEKSEGAFQLPEGTYNLTVDLNAMTLTIELATAIQNTTVESAQKLIVNGQVVILRNGVRYNLTGAQF